MFGYIMVFIIQYIPPEDILYDYIIRINKLGVII